MVLEAEKQKDELRRSELLSYFAGIPATARIEEGDILSHLADAINNDNVDLVVVGAQHRRFVDSTVLGVTTVRVTRHATCPVLVIPRAQAD